jgi:hypothetical protein
MDTKKVFSWIGIFLFGVIVGGLVFYLMCCKCNVCCQHSCKNDDGKGGGGGSKPITTISADTANAYFRCYMKSPRSIDTLIAFSVNKEQLYAMKLLAENDSVASFRIYMGMYGDPEPVNMVVGVDAVGTDMTEIIYKTAYSEPCPILCDESSDIVKPGK